MKTESDVFDWKRKFRPWEQEFLLNVDKSPTAKRAWRKICGAGLDRAAEGCLYYYACADLSPVVKEAREMRPNLEKAAAARRVVAKRADDPRREMFERRATEAVDTAAKTRYTFPSAGTLADAATLHPAIGKLPIEATGSVLADAADTLRRHGTMIFLAMLKAGAARLGVNLGMCSIVALAGCADASRTLDEPNLARFFRNADIQEGMPGHAEKFISLK